MYRHRPPLPSAFPPLARETVVYGRSYDGVSKRFGIG